MCVTSAAPSGCHASLIICFQPPFLLCPTTTGRVYIYTLAICVLASFFFSQVKEKGNNSRRLPTYLFISPHITIILFRKIYDLLRGNITKNCADRFVLMARPERSHGSQQQQQSIRKREKNEKKRATSLIVSVIMTFSVEHLS